MRALLLNLLLASLPFASLRGASLRGAQSPQQANGVKIGEVDGTSVLVWTRATSQTERNSEGPEFGSILKLGEAQIPEGERLEGMRHAVPGALGELRLRYSTGGETEATTEWVFVTKETDYAHVFELAGLEPATEYSVLCEARSGEFNPISSTVEASFRTAPKPETAAEVIFVVATCQDYPRRDDAKKGHRIYASMLALEPDFFAHLGDIVYYDKPAPFASTVALARYKWNRMYALPYQRDFHRRVPSYFLKDDHDLLKDDCWPGQSFGELTWEDGLRLLREQLPVPRADKKPYRTVRWGSRLQIWLLEGREFRSSNRAEDGPEKTILGKQQKAWLAQTLGASDAAFKVVLSATPFVGPDRGSKNDNHANEGFAHEGAEMRALLAEHGVVVINGDRHWQYVSRDERTGLVELGCGPASDAHAGGYPKNPAFEPEFVRVKGGFLSVEIDAEAARLRHHDVNGTVVNELLLGVD